MPAPVGISCDLCGQKFFSKSLPIHRKQCEKKMATNFTDCPKCLRKVSNDEFEKHKSECKVIRKVKMEKPKIVKERTIKPARQDGESDDDESSSSDEEDSREECGFCHRKFNTDRIAKHESVCATNAERKTRKKFKTPAEQRLEGTEFAKYIDPKSRRVVEKPQSTWRQDHHILMNTVEQGRLVKAFQDAGVPLTEMPRPGADLREILEGSGEKSGSTPAGRTVPEGSKMCPHCDRVFADATAEKHIPVCKKTVNKPKTLVRKSQVVLERPKEDHSGVIKELIQKVLLMKSKKDDYFETKEASMFRMDERVHTGDGRQGAVRFIGRISELNPGYWIGIELDEPQGNGNGMIERSTYFKCAEKHAVFLRPSKVKKNAKLLVAEIEKAKADAKADAKTDAKAGTKADTTAEVAASKQVSERATTKSKETAPVKKEKAKDEQPKEKPTKGEQSKEKAPKVEQAKEKPNKTEKPSEMTSKVEEPKDRQPKSSAKEAPAASASEPKELRRSKEISSSETTTAAAKAKKQGMVERLRTEVQVNSPRSLNQETIEAPRSKQPAVHKQSQAEIAKKERLAKDVKFLQALHNKSSQPERASSREEASESSFQNAGTGQSLGSSTNVSKPAAAKGSGGNANADREARAAYFERMFQSN